VHTCGRNQHPQFIKIFPRMFLRKGDMDKDRLFSRLMKVKQAI
jgi:hypothetical protein